MAEELRNDENRRAAMETMAFLMKSMGTAIRVGQDGHAVYMLLELTRNERDIIVRGMEYTYNLLMETLSET